MRGLSWLALTLITLPLSAQQKIERRIAIAPDAAIRISNFSGSVRVLGWDRDSIAVTGLAPPHTSFYMAGSGRMAKLGLEPDDPKNPVSGGTLDVRVPRHARIWVRSSGGAIDVQALEGEVDLVSVGGTLRVTGSPRLVSAESIDGDIELVGPIRLIRAKSGAGRILLRQSSGDITATTVSGPIVVTEGEPESARFETVTGPVSYGGTLSRRGSLNIQTHSGDIELLVPTSLGAEFDLESTGGSVAIELPAKTGKPLKGKSLFFANAGGGAQIIGRSFKGQIRVYGQ